MTRAAVFWLLMGEEEQQERGAKDHCCTRLWETLVQISFQLQFFLLPPLSFYLTCFLTLFMNTLRIQCNKSTDQWGKELPFIAFTNILHKWLPSALWHCSGACWRELQQGHSLAGVGEGQLAPQVKGWVKHHHPKRQKEAPCPVRPHQVIVHCGSHLFEDCNCCTQDILLMLSWSFFRPLLLALQ